MIVECAVYRAGGVYRAVCLDLGLIVERPSADDAARELMDLIKAYVQDAREAGIAPEDLLRPVPRAERLYVYRKVISALVKALVLSAVRRSGRRPGNSQQGRVEYLSCSV